jgi:hypothetical protein
MVDKLYTVIKVRFRSSLYSLRMTTVKSRFYAKCVTLRLGKVAWHVLFWRR